MGRKASRRTLTGRGDVVVGASDAGDSMGGGAFVVVGLVVWSVGATLFTAPTAPNDAQHRDATLGPIPNAATEIAKTSPPIDRRGWTARVILAASVAAVIVAVRCATREQARFVVVLPDPPGPALARASSPSTPVSNVLPPSAVSSARSEPSRLPSIPVRRAAPTTGPPSPRAGTDPMNGRY